MGRRSPLLLMTSISIFSQFAQHVGFSWEPRDLANLMTSQWVFISITKALSNISPEKISELFQSIAKHCPPNLTKDEISWFSSHSWRVWAVVLLDGAGMNSDIIKSQLCWMGDSYRLYLRDNVVLQAKNVTALEQSSFDVIYLYGENCTTLPDIVSWQLQHGFLSILSFLKKKGISKGGGQIPTFRKHNSILFSFNLFFSACVQYIAALSYLRQNCT